MKRFSNVLLLLTSVMIACNGGTAAESRHPLIGILAWSSCGEDDPDFVAGLADWGRIPGKTVDIACRSAEGRYEGLTLAAKGLVDLKVDVIVTQFQPGGRAAQEATQTIPIISIISGDPVAGGLAKSLAKPGGNVTGVTYYATELTGKRLELLKELTPALTTVGVLANPNVSYLPFEEDTKRAAKLLGLRPVFAYVRDPTDLAEAYRQMKSAGAEAVFILPDMMLAGNGPAIADLALASNLPSMGWAQWYTGQGVLMAYSADYHVMTRRLGFYVDRVLSGVPPGDIPIEQPRNFELSINATTARKLGIEIPAPLLIRADRVVE
jgi:putative tryptophan/tyrosine transport system substrate-binding protein